MFCRQFIFSFLLVTIKCLPLFAQEEQELIRQMKQADSRERIVATCFYFDNHVHSRSSEQINFFFSECYSIAAKENDKLFKAYLDLYQRVKEILLPTGDDPYTKQKKMLAAWQQALAYYESVGDERSVLICNAYIGHTYFMLKEYARSIEKWLETDEGFQKHGYAGFPDIGKHLHNMALVFYFFRNYEKVAELMETSIRLPPYSDNYDIQRYNTLGASYMHLQQYANAESAFKKTKETAIAYQNPLWIALASRGLAKVRLNEGNYTEAFHLFERTLDTVKKVNQIAGYSYNREYSEHLLGLAKTCILLNKPVLARHYMDSLTYKRNSYSTEQMFMFGITYQDINYWLEFYDVQHRYYYATRNFEKAYAYADSQYAIRYKLDSNFNGLEIQVAQNRIEAQKKLYENEKKEVTIKSKNRQMLLIGSLLAVITVASVLLFRQNKKIKTRNKIINKQVAGLTKTLEQKQVLLSELQHRVKNNLQHVISILEIQKESVDFNNIDELIRGNQNRIHSMALLHKKLNVTDNVQDVDIKRYITELSELVKDSYESKKIVQLSVNCQVEKISIEKALPVGLIIVELVSNSMKHAFKKLNIGIIRIELTNNGIMNKLYYSDNGSGFDFFQKNEKGLGLEIIKGLIDQLDGEITVNNTNEFELIVYFK